MADSEFGQLWATLEMQNNVSDKLRQVIQDLKLVDESIVKTRKEFDSLGDIKLSNGINDIEKNWRSFRGAILDVENEISKLQQKMSNMGSIGLGDTAEYKRYEDSMKRLITLKNELTNSRNRGDMIGSEDVARAKQEFSLLRKEVAGTDIAAKDLVNTQRANISQVEQMVNQYTKMASTLASVRQSGLDVGLGYSDTNFAQTTVNRIQQAMEQLRVALNDPSSISSGFVQSMEQQFQHLQELATRHAGMIRDKMSMKAVTEKNTSELYRMENSLQKINELMSRIRRNDKINVDLTSLDTARQHLEQLMQRYREFLSNKNSTKMEGSQLANEYRRITHEVEMAANKVKELEQAEKRRVAESEKANRANGASSARQVIQANQQIANSIDMVANRMEKMRNQTSRTGKMFDQFKTQIAFTAFSVYGLERFLTSIITIGGEFERQRVALQNMLGDMREANEIFGQLKSLALESPFTFRQLSTYTKQLAAFSIPYEELYDTNRRLSDMSAGLGVDMSRLILAYGQVRAATVLRGQELRQFTEAGVPMVDKLADYFTKLNGQLVTTKDIFKMISAKQVPFEAVKAVMQEMTDEGGMFYNMQAKIADTLSGRWGNLKDAWEILLGELADGEGIIGKVLKFSVEGITKIIRSLGSLIGVIGGLGVGKVLGRAGMLSASMFGIGYGGKTDRQFLAAKRLAAIDIQKKALTQQIDDIERRTLQTRNKITTLDRISMLRNGQISSYKAAMLAKDSQMSKNALMRLALEQGITKEQIRQIGTLSNQSKFSLWRKEQGSKISNWWGGVDKIGFGISAGIMAIGAAIGYYVQKKREMDEAIEKSTEELKSTNLDLSDFMSKNKIYGKLDDENAMRAVEKYEEELKKVEPEYLWIKSKIVGENGESPQEQAEKYYNALQNAMDGARLALDKGTTERLVEGFDLPGPINAEDLFNETAKKIKENREKIIGLQPQDLKKEIWSLSSLDNTTKEVASHFVDIGRKADAWSIVSREIASAGTSLIRFYNEYQKFSQGKITEKELYGTINSIYSLKKETKELAINLIKAGKAGEAYKSISEELQSKRSDFVSLSNRFGIYSDTTHDKGITDFVEQQANLIREEWSEYFESGEFDKDKKGAAAARSGIMQMLRNASSKRNMTTEGRNIYFELMEQTLFGESPTAMQQLADSFTNKFKENREFIVKSLQENGIDGVVGKQLRQEAYNIGAHDWEFSKQIEEIFKNPIELTRLVLLNFDVEYMEPWKQKMANDFGDIPAITAAIKAAPDRMSAIDSVEKLHKTANETVKKLGGIIITAGIKLNGNNLISNTSLDNIPAWLRPYIDDYNAAMSQLNAINSQQKSYNLDFSGGNKDKNKNKNKSTGSKEDKELNSWKKHVDLYKKFLDQYRELTRMWGEKKALDTLRNDDSYNWVFEFAKKNGVDVFDAKNYNKALMNNLDASKSQKRKDAKADRQAEITKEMYKEQSDALKRLNDTLNEHLKILNEQYDAYEKIFQITGNMEGAMSVAFGGHVTNQRYVDELTQQLSDAIRAAGKNVSVEEALGYDKETINKVFGEESVAANRIKDLKEKRNKLEKEYIDILANSLSSDQTLEDKRAEATRKHNKEIEKLIELRKKQKTQEGRDAVDRAIQANNNAYNRTDAGFEQQIYERDTSLSGVLNNLSVFSEDMLRQILSDLDKQRSRLMFDNTPEGIEMFKKLTEQVAKIKDYLDEKNPYQLLKEAFKNKPNPDIMKGSDGSYSVFGATAVRYNLKQGQKVDEKTVDAINAAERSRKLSLAIENISKDFKALDDILKPVIDLFDALGMEDTPIGAAMSAGTNALSSAGGVAGSFSALSASATAAGQKDIGKFLGKAGPYAAAAAAAFSVATTIIQLHDKAIQKEIDASKQRQQEMENLSKNLKTELERVLGGIYTAGISKSTKDKFNSIIGEYNAYQGMPNWFKKLFSKKNPYSSETVSAMSGALSKDSWYQANYASMLAQKDELQMQLDLEKDKKKKDDSVIKDLEQKLIESEDLISNYAKDMAKELYDIDIKSWAKDLTEAIVDAWAAGEDAVEAYKKKVKEMMKSLAINIIAQKIMEPLMADIEKAITKSMNDKSGKLDETDLVNIGNELMKVTDVAVANVTGLLEYLKGAGWDLSELSDESTLGKGIQSITEDTADLLASYINAIRADVAAIRAIEERAIESGFLDVNASLTLQLTELRNISSFAERNAFAAEKILDLFDSVTTVGASGRKVRV